MNNHNLIIFLVNLEKWESVPMFPFYAVPLFPVVKYYISMQIMVKLGVKNMNAYYNMKYYEWKYILNKPFKKNGI